MATLSAKNISVFINRLPAEVYDFVVNPENLPKWASGLGSSVKNVNGEWIAEGPMGKIKIKFVDKNNYGVLDHDVILPSGVKCYNPMRVFKNNEGSELVFTAYRQPGMPEEKFIEDAEWVQKDLKKLKALLEK